MRGMPELHTEVQFLKGIGPRVAETLAAKGIHTLEDLLYYLPFRYEDRINPRTIEQLKPGEMASVIAEVRTSGLFRTRRMPIFEMTAGQGRSKLKCLWFRRRLPGRQVQARRAGGALRQSRILHLWPRRTADAAAAVRDPARAARRRREPTESEEQKHFESLEIGRIVPIYEATGKLNARWFRRIIRTALEQMPPEVTDAIPAAIRGRLGLIPRAEAFWHVHWPDAGESFADLQAARTPAHQRLIFEELFFLELGLELKRRKARLQPGIGLRSTAKYARRSNGCCPFIPRMRRSRC